MSDEQLHKILLNRLDDMEISQGKRFKAIEDKLDPIHEVFTAATGFQKVTVIILKGLAAIGAAILALYIVIEFFKKLGRS